MPLRKLHRIENVGADIGVVRDALRSYGPFDRLFLAEGDSWFDIFTPFPLEQPNLLSAIESESRDAVVDTAQIGETAEGLAGGWQALRTLELLDHYAFDALLLSAGGNDLIDAFAQDFVGATLASRNRKPISDRQALALSAPAEVTEHFAKALDAIEAWIALRDGSKLNGQAPVLIHGYDYLQPRPAPALATIFGGRVRGPWIHPGLQQAGKSDAEMLAMAKDVVNRFNDELQARFRTVPNVVVIDSRNTLTPAAPGAIGKSKDWMDEIHPTVRGFQKLARKHWNAALKPIPKRARS